ncbi:carbohydrate-binding protein [Paenibacillus sp. GCM10023248]|uniref:carbohydrate-binding protein n=1 Tax=unclassified Paenibacillus TaxID=185978 RepID=UPI002378E542|nr:carbohydrate-binding protein [Paenibacillus sp. MAHUQ-63]MDD9265452.1 carbohydrate-binding protein [Paenibacillus sp. MAHUQ-63]
MNLRLRKSFSILLACVTAMPLFFVPAPAEVSAASAANDVIVNLSAEKQVIRGFGGINHPAWIGDLTPAQRETAFGNGDNQLGFSVLRIFIDPNKNNWYKELETAKKAIERGAIVFASPWNPPSEMLETFTLGMSSGNGTTYEAETGTTLTNSVVEMSNSGYSGTGYVNFQAASDAAIQWGSIGIGSTGTKNVRIRYALQEGTSNLDIYVNGTKMLTDVAFAATGSLSTWGEKSVQVPMISGNNTIKLVTTGTDGPNVDHINLSAYVEDPSAKRLKHDMYDEYAQYLNEFDTYMKSNGVELYAISVQNEPDYAHDWTWWSPEEMLSFMKENAGTIHNRVIAPESFSYVKQMSDPILNDPEALANLDILGAHTYGTNYKDFPYPLFEQKGTGKELWMTEVYYPNSENNSADRWPEALGVAEHMYNAMVEGNFQTYVWWYIRRQYGPMKEDGTISKRGYMMAHYSKFIRPGYVRVEATKNPDPQIFTSAYKGNNKAVIVAVNKGNTAVSQKFVLQNETATNVASWLTDSTRNLTAGAPIQVTNGSFTAELPAQSVTTFVADIHTGNLVPTAALSADNRVMPGSSFTVGVSLNNLGKSVYAEDITLTYDANKFDYVSAAAANRSIEIVGEEEATAGKVRLIAANIGGVTGASTPALNLYFKVKAGVQNTTGTIEAAKADLADSEGTVIQAALDSKNISIGSEVVIVDKTALTTAISSAQSLYDAAVVGTESGQYPQAAKDAFGSAIDAAKVVRDNASATQPQVDSAVAALGSAVEIFKAAVIQSPDLNKDGNVDVGDLAIAAYHYGKDSNSADWETAKRADLNGDHKIDIMDIAYIASKIIE